MMGKSNLERWQNRSLINASFRYLFECRGEGTSKGWPKSTTGDVIGCGIDFTTGQAFFTRNGECIGNAFSGLAKRGRLFPAVGLRTPG
jgi:hypothetical protein